jgi:hypothetical protein
MIHGVTDYFVGKLLAGNPFARFHLPNARKVPVVFNSL